MSEPWHPYVFDTDRRRFVGEFEAMYQAEAQQGFDSWHQSDPRLLQAKIAGLLLDEITYRSVLDLGCGKGAFTAQLKRRDNRVTGLDASETAIAAARASFPDVDWVCAPAEDYLEQAGPVDLIVMREVLSYLERWREVIAACARRSTYCLIGLFLPPDPIGFVKSHDELNAELERHFRPLEAVMITPRQLVTSLWESRTPPPAAG